MALIKPFLCVRPADELGSRVAALPYDVYNRAEAKAEAAKDPLSFLNIDRPESFFPDDVDIYDPRVYAKAREVLDQEIADGIFVKETRPCYYLYELTMNGHTQTGIVACSSVDDYLEGTVRKHENTRADKELDRINHVDITNAQTGPIFLAYRARKALKEIIASVKEGTALYDFVSDDGVKHRVFRIADEELIAKITEEIGAAGTTYIADGHHRAASAVKVALKRREQNPGYDGTEEFNYFLSVLFADDELKILAYNRVVKDLNGYTSEEFMAKLAEKFDITEDASANHEPDSKGKCCMRLDGKWYVIAAKPEIMNPDPVKGLDVSLLQDNVLAPMLGIEDPRTDKRVDFIGGIRGTKELEKRTDEDCVIAFSMYPTAMSELLAVADAHLLMPPKSTWFEPKLRSGLFIHKLS